MIDCKLNCRRKQTVESRGMPALCDEVLMTAGVHGHDKMDAVTSK